MASFLEDLNREVSSGVNKVTGTVRDNINKATKPFGELGGYIGEGLAGTSGAKLFGSSVETMGQLIIGAGGAIGQTGVAAIHGLGNAVGDTYNEVSGVNAQKEAQKKAEQRSIKARRDSLRKQFGARQQADSASLASMRNSYRSATGGSGIGVDNTQGSFMGDNMVTTAGTF